MKYIFSGISVNEISGNPFGDAADSAYFMILLPQDGCRKEDVAFRTDSRSSRRAHCSRYTEGHLLRPRTAEGSVR